jgi:hypothetical protein
MLLDWDIFLIKISINKSINDVNLTNNVMCNYDQKVFYKKCNKIKHKQSL